MPQGPKAHTVVGILAVWLREEKGDDLASNPPLRNRDKWLLTVLQAGAKVWWKQEAAYENSALDMDSSPCSTMQSLCYDEQTSPNLSEPQSPPLRVKAVRQFHVLGENSGCWCPAAWRHKPAVLSRLQHLLVVWYLTSPCILKQGDTNNTYLIGLLGSHEFQYMNGSQ